MPGERSRVNKRVRVYLPKHVRWLVLPILGVVWVVLTVAAFLPSENPRGPDLVAWALGTLVLGFVAVVIWLQSSGRWPAYLLEIEEDPESDR
jgi:hypothetical protein